MICQGLMNNKIFIIFLWAHFVFNSELLLARNLISDSLVENVDCDNLTIQDIHSHIRPEAFNLNRHIPIKNWSFPNGPYSLGVCWSLSHAQRLFFYLARWSPYASNDSQYNSSDGINILNLIRGSRPIKGSLNDIKETEISKFYTFDFQSFSTESGLFADIINGIWDPLHDFFPDPMNSESIDDNMTTTDIAELKNIYIQSSTPFRIEDGKLFRKFKLEIERYQRWRFHQFQNSKMVTDPVPRPKNVNQQTSELLIKAIQQNNLPLVNLKANFNTQHILVVKTFQKDEQEVRFGVYDSNAPSVEKYFTYDIKKQQFNAPEIIKRFRSITNPNQTVSVYIVDAEEQEKIDAALFTHYKEQCRVLFLN